MTPDPNQSLRSSFFLDDWQAELRAAGNAEATVVKWRRIVERGALLAGRTTTEVTSADLAYWLATFSNSNTRRTYWIAWRAWSTWLVERSVRPDDPTRPLRRPKVPRAVPKPVSASGVARLLELPVPPRLHMMLLLAIFQGFRVSEIACMSHRLLDFDAKLVRVIGKGGLIADVPMHPRVEEFATELPATGWWFPHTWHPDRHIVGVTVGGKIKTAMNTAGVPGVPHGLRHSFATELLREGANIRIVQQLMRHSYLATTEGYLGVTDEERRTAMLRLYTVNEP